MATTTEHRRSEGRARWRQRTANTWRSLTTAQLFVASFLALVLAGAAGLKLVPWFHAGRPLTWLEALFTATSAVCVTGLAVVDTATFFTPMGQGFILLLVQLGGLGIITYTSLIIIALGRRLSLRSEALSASDALPHIDPRRLTRNVVLFTVGIEGAGALLLYLLWSPRLGWDAALWPAVFHAVNAFCNAGFSTFSDSLVGFQRSPATLLVVAALIVLGGIGFMTMEELHVLQRPSGPGGRRRLSVHSRLVFVTTGVLILGGWVFFAAFEWHNTLRALPVLDRLTNALFLSVTARTAGFNSIDYTQAADSSNFLTVLLMYIGGSPGSTAGGLKTTTFALIGLLAWSRMRGREIVSVWGRTIPEETIQRAVGLFVVVASVATAGIFLLTWMEVGWGPSGDGPSQFLAYVFEVASAFNTVGLTMGLTPGLTGPGQWTMILLMFVGRVGPLTFAAALAMSRKHRGGLVRYAHEDVVIG